VRFLESCGARDLALLHCTALYPTPAPEANLRAIATLASAFPECPVGYSDHTVGIACATAAVALGAAIVEKHFTLDRSLPGPDHHFSADPTELRELVAAIHTVEAALGSGRKQPTPAEVGHRASWQRCLVAARDLDAGAPITLETIAVKRSEGGGLPARLLPLLLGHRTRRPLRAEEPLRWDGID
jgi:sialic acid synthase SpsE